MISIQERLRLREAARQAGVGAATETQAADESRGPATDQVGTIVENLLNRGVAFAEYEGALVWFAPAGIVTLDMVATLSARKSEILAHFRKLPLRPSGCWSRRPWGDPTPEEVEHLAHQRLKEQADRPPVVGQRKNQ